MAYAPKQVVGPQRLLGLSQRTLWLLYSHFIPDSYIVGKPNVWVHDCD